jgi:putative SOS response-associated peptidase YedK
MPVIQPSEADMQARVVYAIAPQDGKPLAFAGIWETFRWPDETTTRPNAEMDELHDRMPVILEEQDWPVWLAELDGDHGAILRPAPDGTLQTWPVDRRVGSPRNNGKAAAWREDHRPGSITAGRPRASWG